MTEISAWNTLQAAIEHFTGKNTGELRNQTIDERRREVEEKTGRKFRLKKFFPLVGRGNVLRDHITTSDLLSGSHK